MAKTLALLQQISLVSDTVKFASLFVLLFNATCKNQRSVAYCYLLQHPPRGNLIWPPFQFPIFCKLRPDCKKNATRIMSRVIFVPSFSILIITLFGQVTHGSSRFFLDKVIWISNIKKIYIYLSHYVCIFMFHTTYL